MANNLTPMMKQYQEMKEQYPDTLLFFRLGDFYEMFGEDALTGAKVLEITLTGRSAREQGRMPMCGVPYHAAEHYISKLITKGFKVAICDQVEDPKTCKGLVKREVTRVITPGTVVDSALLKNTAANYLACVWQGDGGYGLAYGDISTGELQVTEFKGTDALRRLGDELERINPAECLLQQKMREEDYFKLRVWNPSGGAVLTAIPDEKYISRNAKTLVMTHFAVASLDALGLEELTWGLCALASMLEFARSTQKRDLSYINHVTLYRAESYMLLDAATRRNLELAQTMRQGDKRGSLLWVLDNTLTALGGRLLKNWVESPLLSSDAITLRLDGVEELTQRPLALANLQQGLKGIYDLERLIGRISYGNAGPRDLVALKQSLEQLPVIDKTLASLEAPLFQKLYDHMDLLEDICGLIGDALEEEVPVNTKDGGYIRTGYNKEVDELRQLSKTGKNVLLQLEAQEKERTGIKSLKVGFNKVFGYYIEVTKTNLSLVPEHYIRKQTLANAERYITQELKDWENKILGAAERLNALEYQLFCDLRKTVTGATKRVQATASCIAQLDGLQSLAQVALTNGYCRPQVDDSDQIRIIAGRHPVVEKSIGQENYVPNNAFLNGSDCTFALITGPNMAGKSTYMRQVALIVLMARLGSFVPAQEALIGKVDRIFTRVGASDDLAAGQSTFMVEMCETSNILRHATPQSLVLLDEIGRGTSTYDGLSIAWAVAEYLLLPEKSPRTLFATHYHEMTGLAEHHPQLKNLSVAVKEKDGGIIFLRKIIPGSADKSYGIQVAKLAGLPEQVLRRAKDILATLEQADHKNDTITEQLAFDAMATHEPYDTVTPLERELLLELSGLDLSATSPMEALLFLDRWQRELRRLADDQSSR